MRYIYSLLLIQGFCCSFPKLFMHKNGSSIKVFCWAVQNRRACDGEWWLRLTGNSHNDSSSRCLAQIHLHEANNRGFIWILSVLRDGAPDQEVSRTVNQRIQGFMDQRTTTWFTQPACERQRKPIKPLASLGTLLGWWRWRTTTSGIDLTNSGSLY